MHDHAGPRSRRQWESGVGRGGTLPWEYAAGVLAWSLAAGCGGVPDNNAPGEGTAERQFVFLRTQREKQSRFRGPLPGVNGIFALAFTRDTRESGCSTDGLFTRGRHRAAETKCFTEKIERN